jgi:sirohydrochlorin cobaltochelatase
LHPFHGRSVQIFLLYGNGLSQIITDVNAVSYFSKTFFTKIQRLFSPVQNNILLAWEYIPPFFSWTFISISGKWIEINCSATVPARLILYFDIRMHQQTNPMQTPVILAAFGTTPRAMTTWQALDLEIRKHLPEHPIFWSYTSRGSSRRMQEKSRVDYYDHPSAILAAISKQGHSMAVIQSLHLLPGYEFHQLLGECRQTAISCRFCRPLLTTPQDYESLGDCLEPLLAARPEKAILLIGHGTDHPIWVAYLALETLLRRRFGRRIFVGVIEKNPGSGRVPQEIAAAGFKQVCIVPLLLVAAMHYDRDVIGAGEHSWHSRLTGQGLEVESIETGLGLLPGFSRIITAHIQEALLHAGEQAFPTAPGC